MSRLTNRRIAAAWGAALTLGALAACGPPAVSDGVTSSALPASTVQPVPVAAATTCSPPATASYPPLASTSQSSWPAGSLMQTIKERGYLVVGVSGDTRLLGARNALNPTNPGALEGFDIDMARQVAIALFGKADPSVLRLKVITTGQRFTSVNTGAGTKQAPQTGVDLVARAVTMNCDRWSNPDPAKHAAFSSVYLLAHQKLLVRKGSGVTSVAQLVAQVQKVAQSKERKARVCAPNGSTSLANIKKFDGIQPVGVEIHSDCLALWQQGQVDAITGDDAILAGFVAQDPHAKVVGESLEAEPYGLAVAAAHPEFARFLNAVLEQVRANGTWQKSYDQWLKSALGPVAPPRPDYGRAA